MKRSYGLILHVQFELKVLFDEVHLTALNFAKTRGLCLAEFIKMDKNRAIKKYFKINELFKIFLDSIASDKYNFGLTLLT